MFLVTFFQASVSTDLSPPHFKRFYSRMQVAPTHQHLHAKLCLQHLSGEIVPGHKPFQLQVEQNSSPEAERQKLREMHQLLVSFPRARVRGTATWHHFAEQCLVSCKNFKEPKSFAFHYMIFNWFHLNFEARMLRWGLFAHLLRLHARAPHAPCGSCGTGPPRRKADGGGDSRAGAAVEGCKITFFFPLSICFQCFE